MTDPAVSRFIRPTLFHEPAPMTTAQHIDPALADLSVDRLRAEVADLRHRLEAAEAREGKVMALLKCPSPEKIDHDLRNVMNELVLLRKVLEQEGT